MKYLLLIISIFIIVGCAALQPIVEQSTKSQLELREMQSRTINSTDIKFITKMILQVLQDDGYTIENLDSELGFFVASKKIDGGAEKYKLAVYDIYYPIAIYKLATLGRNVQEVKATISVRVYKNNTKIRASFNAKLVDKKGETQSIKTIDDLKFYQDFFAKVDKALFLEKNDL